MISVKINVDVKDLEKFRQVLRQDLEGSGNGPIRQCLMETWPKIYMEFTVARFDRFSLGGGEWPPLAASTVRKKGHGTILIDTQKLRNTLANPTGSDVGVASIKNGVRISFMSRKLHVGTRQRRTSGYHTLGTIAGFHQRGTDRMPARPIYAQPDEYTQAKLKWELEAAFKRLGFDDVV